MVVTTAHPARPDSRPDPAGWRKAIGRRLREARETSGLRLVDVARLARVSPQYLSEVERGRKEASSEVLAAVTGALGMTLVDLAGGVARDLARAATQGSAHGLPRSSAVPSTRVTVLSSVPVHGPGVDPGLAGWGGLPAGGVVDGSGLVGLLAA